MFSTPPIECSIIANVHLEAILIMLLDTEYWKNNEKEGLQIIS